MPITRGALARLSSKNDEPGDSTAPKLLISFVHSVLDRKVSKKIEGQLEDMNPGMKDKGTPGQSSTKHMNGYEKSKLLRVQENKKKLQALGVDRIAKSLTSLVQSDKSKKDKKKPVDRNDKDAEYMPGSDSDVDDDQDNEEAATKISKKKQQPKFIAPMSMNRYVNLAKKQSIAPNVSRVLRSSESQMQKGQVIDTRTEITNKVPDEVRKINSQPAGDRNSTKQKGELIKMNLQKSNSLTRGKSSLLNRKLLDIDDDDDGEPDMRIDDIDEDEDEDEDENVNEDDAENDDLVDTNMNEPYEEQDSTEDDEDEEMADLENVNSLGNENNEVTEEELQVPQLDNEEEPEHLQPENEADQNARKRVRGPTRMPKVWAQQDDEDRIPVLFNAYGQPIDEKSSQLTHFMGTIARSGKYCPIYKPWNKVDKAKKQALLELIKTKFDIPEERDVERWILKSFGQKVKNWRGRLKDLYHDPSVSLQDQISSRPKQVQKKQWKKLVKYWNDEKSKMLSDKNKENRAKKKMVQVTGKKSYARVREELKASSGQDPSRLEMFHACFSKDGNTKTVEAANAILKMKQFSSNLPEGSIDKPGPDDVFSKVMGKDRNGDAVMYGLGVRASDVWGVLPSRSSCRRENIRLKSKCDKLTGTVAELQAQVLKMNGPRDGSSAPSSTSQCPVVTKGPPRLRVGDEVFVRSILDSDEIVAKGRVKSLDPNEVVGGIEIGPKWCEVNVQVPIKSDEKLVRPYGLFSTIQDCIGASIAWPCTFISVVPED